ncbi:MAG: glutamate formimidoyltransferase, partial [Gemmatimonadetes bacterium]|nr:glutamate formimidoyltransferase [Gemmatimonadota bacterium]
CVPNFSEGRDPARIEKITDVLRAAPGVTLLDVDPGFETNRTVVTFVGAPDDVVEAAFRAIAKAAEVLDMRQHSGAHPRMGATDVCPFVPVSGVTMEDCAELARRLGRRVGEELGIPVYLYEHAASRPERRNLADVRAGEYEGLAARAGKSEWKPDFGPNEFRPKTGATAIGAREFLIAYNVNVNVRSRDLAHDIALDVRDRGRRKRDAEGKPIRGADGQFEMIPGRFRECKAVGWYIPEYGAAQVSINLTNYHVTSMHDVFDAICEGATARGLRVTGSEIVGLVPLEAIRRAGVHVLKKAGLSAGVPERELVHAAVKGLGLDDLAPFDPADKIIEYRLRREGLLVDRTIANFADELSTDSPAPGGGSVASLCGTLSAALTAMVTNLTVGRKGYEGVSEGLKDVGYEAQSLKDAFLADIDRDTDAFNELFAAMKKKRGTPEEVAERDRAILDATKHATEVPLGVLQRAARAAELAGIVADQGNRNSLSDAGVAALTARACADGAFYNVLINLPGVTDSGWAEDVRSRATKAVEAARRTADDVAARVQAELERALTESVSP